MVFFPHYFKIVIRGRSRCGMPETVDRGTITGRPFIHSVARCVLPPTREGWGVEVGTRMCMCAHVDVVRRMNVNDGFHQTAIWVRGSSKIRYRWYRALPRLISVRTTKAVYEEC